MKLITTITHYYLTILLCGVFVLPVINSNAQLAAHFTTDLTGGCSPIAISFTNTSTGITPGTTFFWDFDNGNTSESKDAGAIFTKAHVYRVKLTAKNGNISSSETKEITVYAAPSADFNVSKNTGCVPLSIDFVASATPGDGVIVSYLWDFGDGNTLISKGTSVDHTYTLAQPVSMSLTVTNSYGCSYPVKKKPVQVFAAPLAEFTADDSVLCNPGQAASFKAIAGQPGTFNYSWDFGDGNTSSNVNPQNIYKQSGIYTVSLKVSSSGGCSSTMVKNNFIRVDNFKSDFSVPATLCNGTENSFINLTDPTPSLSKWYINDQEVSSTGFPDALKYTFTNAGNYEVKLLNTIAYCKDSVTKKLTVKKGFNLDGFLWNTQSKCGAPVKIIFDDTSTSDVSRQWNFDALNNPSTVNSTAKHTEFTYTKNGEYLVRLSAKNMEGCSVDTSRVIEVKSPVTVSIDKEPLKCGPYSLTFSAHTNGDAIVSYVWKFEDDGSISTSAAPFHSFNKTGSHTVTLEYTTTAGCSGTETYIANVYEPPVANFFAPITNVCGNAPVVFTAQPQDGASYTWNFGNGVIQSGSASQTYSYTYDSVFTVQLIVTNPGGCIDTFTREQYINVTPPFSKISAVYNNCTERGSVTFFQKSLKADTWIWDFGDGSSTSFNTDEPSVTHVYNKTGTYEVVLTVTNGACSSKSMRYVGVLLNQKPVLKGDKTTVCSNGQVNFELTGLEKAPLIKYPWKDYNFERIEYSDLTEFKGDSLPGDYWINSFNGSLSGFEKNKTGIRIILKSEYGCQDTTNFIPLDIKWSEPVFQTSTPTCFKSQAIFEDKSVTNSSIISRQWDFGDNTSPITGNNNLTSHKYAVPGTFAVKLTVSDLYQCTYSTTEDVIINGPQAGFSLPDSSYITLPVKFNNTSITFDSLNTTYKWAFSDGGLSTEYSPAHAFSLPGQYNITLIANNANFQCTDTISYPIVIKDFKANFKLENSFLGPNNCLPVLVKLTNTSVNYTNVNWDFGDSTTVDPLNSPSHVYVFPGKYIVTLIADGPEGLKAVHTDSVIVKGPEAVLNIDKTEICKGQSIGFTAIPGKGTIGFTWDFGDGVLEPNSVHNVISHPYTLPGKVFPALIVFDSAYCKTSYAVKDGIIVRGDPVVTFSPDPAVICRGSSINITANEPMTYQWLPANGLISANGATASVSPLITSDYYIKATDDIGCIGYDTVTVTVIQPPQISVTSTLPQCLGKPVALKSMGAAHYKWINNISGIHDINSGETFVTAPSEGENLYTVTGMDDYNCFADTAEVKVNVLSLPKVHISPVDDVVYMQEITLNASTSSDVVQWQWSPAKYLSCVLCPNPVSTPKEPMEYTLTVTNNNGCVYSDAVTVSFLCKEDVVRIPGAFSPNSDGLNDVFMIKGVTTINWLKIYNRLGNLVFERKDFNANDNSNAWDGYYKGSPAEIGTYVYFANIKCTHGSAFTKKGTVLLVR